MTAVGDGAVEEPVLIVATGNKSPPGVVEQIGEISSVEKACSGSIPREKCTCRDEAVDRTSLRRLCGLNLY